jgi:AraC-like DNA-binding protein
MPACRIFEFTDPDRYQAAIRASNIELFPTTRGAFFAELTQIDLHRLWMQRGNENLPTISHGVVTADRAVIEFLSGWDQPAFQHNGVDVPAGEIVVDNRRSAHRRCSRSHHWGSMSLPPADLAAAGYALVGRELTIPAMTRVVRPASEPMRRLLLLHQSAGQLARAAPDTLSHPEVARSLEQALVHAMVRCLSDGTSAEPRVSIRHHSKIMARLEDFFAAHPDRPAYLSEICAATGVSERMLRTCCHEQLGVGPVRYLWLRRMHFARRALLRTDPSAASVTEIAADHGFGELGRFSVQYRTLFGESPSASLRRPPDNRRAPASPPSVFA